LPEKANKVADALNVAIATLRVVNTTNGEQLANGHWVRRSDADRLVNLMSGDARETILRLSSNRGAHQVTFRYVMAEFRRILREPTRYSPGVVDRVCALCDLVFLILAKIYSLPEARHRLRLAGAKDDHVIDVLARLRDPKLTHDDKLMFCLLSSILPASFTLTSGGVALHQPVDMAADLDRPTVLEVAKAVKLVEAQNKVSQNLAATVQSDDGIDSRDEFLREATQAMARLDAAFGTGDVGATASAALAARPYLEAYTLGLASATASAATQAARKAKKEDANRDAAARRRNALGAPNEASTPVGSPSASPVTRRSSLLPTELLAKLLPQAHRGGINSATALQCGRVTSPSSSTTSERRRSSSTSSLLLFESTSTAQSAVVDHADSDSALRSPFVEAGEAAKRPTSSSFPATPAGLSRLERLYRDARHWPAVKQALVDSGVADDIDLRNLAGLVGARREALISRLPLNLLQQAMLTQALDATL
jgi:hypothetical protein